MAVETGISDRVRIGRAVGSRIRMLRESQIPKKWSQETLAHEAGVTKETVRWIEKGRLPEWGTLEKIADALGVSLGFLLTGATSARLFRDQGALLSTLMLGDCIPLTMSPTNPFRHAA
jgi:transcriptional regulator with XRE-family HTH domain